MMCQHHATIYHQLDWAQPRFKLIDQKVRRTSLVPKNWYFK
jgi:hypothetical protein